MVKPDTSGSGEFYWFESDVIPDSGKTKDIVNRLNLLFESDVIPDSGKTGNISTTTFSAFESDVIPDSGKTALLDRR